MAIPVDGLPFSASVTARRPAPIFCAASAIVRLRRRRAVRRLAPSVVKAFSTSYGGALSKGLRAFMRSQRFFIDVYVLLRANHSLRAFANKRIKSIGVRCGGVGPINATLLRHPRRY